MTEDLEIQRAEVRETEKNEERSGGGQRRPEKRYIPAHKVSPGGSLITRYGRNQKVQGSNCDRLYEPDSKVFTLFRILYWKAALPMVES